MNSLPPLDSAFHPTALRDPGKAPERREQDAKKNGKRRTIARAIGFCALAVLAGLVGFGVWSKSSREAEADAVLEARLNAIPSVRTFIAKEDSAPRMIELTGNMTAFDSATLYARATGYISVRHADIGTKLKKGDVLAIIAAPDLDQQLAQAKGQLVQFQAAVQQAEANADLGRVTDQRTARLVAQGWSSAQQGDTDRLTLASRQAAVAVAKANVVAQQAAVDRLQQLTDFEQIKAPFDGVVTGRLIDVGSLVTADAASGTPAVLDGADGRPAGAGLRAAGGDLRHQRRRSGDDHGFGVARAHLHRPGRAQRQGVVGQDPHAADGGRCRQQGRRARRRSLQHIHLQVRRPNPVIIVPSQAVIFNRDGLMVAVVSDGKVSNFARSISTSTMAPMSKCAQG